MQERRLSKARFLVTGGAGFIGSNFVHYLLKHVPGSTVIVVDKLSYAGNKHNLDGLPKRRLSFVKADINETERMIKLFAKVDYVVHLAAESHVDRSIHGFTKEFVTTNVLGTHSLLEALRKSPNIKLFVHMSTDEVFGTLSINSRSVFSENSPYRPNSPYAASKAAADMMVRSFVQTWQVPIVTLHPANNYGPRQLPEKLIPFFTMRALNDLPVTIYGHGRHVRSWLYVDDCASAILTVLEKGVIGEHYCVASGEELQNIETTKRILKTLHKPFSLMTYVTDRPGHDERYALDASKLRKLGWKPTHKLSVYLPKTVLWYKINRKSFNGHVKN